MKKQAYTIIAAVVLFGCLAISAQAQCVSGTQARASIPFQFKVGEETMPAGEYTFDCLTMPRGVLFIHNADQKVSRFVVTKPLTANSEGRARLVFRRYGNQYFLAQTWNGGSKSGVEIPKSRAERAIERELAAMTPSLTEVALSKR